MKQASMYIHFYIIIYSNPANIYGMYMPIITNFAFFAFLVAIVVVSIPFYCIQLCQFYWTVDNIFYIYFEMNEKNIFIYKQRRWQQYQQQKWKYTQKSSIWDK